MIERHGVPGLRYAHPALPRRRHLDHLRSNLAKSQQQQQQPKRAEE